MLDNERRRWHLHVWRRSYKLIKDHPVPQHQGGGLFIHGALCMGSSEIADCWTGIFGGGIYVYHGGMATVENSTIRKCSSEGSGGCILLDGYCHGVFYDVRLEWCSAGFEGGESGRIQRRALIFVYTFRRNSHLALRYDRVRLVRRSRVYGPYA